MSEPTHFSNKEETISLPSERMLASKRDRCLSNLIVNGGLGFCLGVGASVLLFRRRAWPLFLATGFGFGTAYAECQRTFHMGFEKLEKKP